MPGNFILNTKSRMKTPMVFNGCKHNFRTMAQKTHKALLTYLLQDAFHEYSKPKSGAKCTSADYIYILKIKKNIGLLILFEKNIDRLWNVSCDKSYVIRHLPLLPYNSKNASQEDSRLIHRSGLRYFSLICRPKLTINAQKRNQNWDNCRKEKSARQKGGLHSGTMSENTSRIPRRKDSC